MTMAQDLLSVHSVEGEAREPMSETKMRQFMGRVGVLEEEIKSAGAWVFSGRLHEPDTATVVRVSDGVSPPPLAGTRGLTACTTSTPQPKIDEAEVGRIFREESGRSVAALIRVFGVRPPGERGVAGKIEDGRGMTETVDLRSAKPGDRVSRHQWKPVDDVRSMVLSAAKPGLLGTLTAYMDHPTSPG
jgi:hypothetical protein